MNLIPSFQKWWAKPFDPSGDAAAWSLTFLLIIVMAGFWQFVLLELRREL